MYLTFCNYYHLFHLLTIIDKTILTSCAVVCVKLLCRFCSVHCHYTKASSLPQIYSVLLRASLPVYVLRAPPTFQDCVHVGG